MTSSPTARQIEVLEVIAEHTRRNGYAPTVREIGDALAVSSTNAVADHLSALRRRGLVTWRVHHSRTLSVTTDGQRWLQRSAA